MKIAYMSFSHIPSRAANSIHIMKMCDAFSQLGHEVTLFVPDGEQFIEKGVEDEFRFYGVERSFQIVRVPLHAGIGRAYQFGYLSAKYAQKWGADYVLTRSIHGAYFSLQRNLRTSLEMHQSYEDGKADTRWLLKSVLKHRYLKSLIVITHSLKKYFSGVYPFITSRLHVVPDAADPVRQNLLPQKLNGQSLNVGYVGHLYKGKGMEIVSAIAPSCPWATFHIVGGTDQDQDYWRKLMKNYTNVIFHGYVPHSEVYSYILAFDVVLLPNQEQVQSSGGTGNISNWTSPLKLFEYMASGKLIIASDLPVLKEILCDGVNAILCSHDKPDEWVEALQVIRDQPELRQKIAASAKKDFIQNYTWEKRAQRIVENDEVISDSAHNLVIQH